MTGTLLGPPQGPAEPSGPPVVRIQGTPVRCGTTSWADRSLVRDGLFYPRKTMTASERLAYYCTQLAVAEIATTYRFPPTADLARQWVARTPEGFRFDVRCWSLLTRGPTLPDSLWPDLHDEVRGELRHRRRLYADHLSEGALEECWVRFAHALVPLRDAGRLGAVVLHYPSWFTPKPDSLDVLTGARAALAGFEVAVELTSPRWFEDDACDTTLEWLEGAGIGFVCIDGPANGPRATPPVVATTSDLALVRFRGRRYQEGEPWTWPYRYSDAELAGWVPRIRELATASAEVHVLMDNTWRSDAVDNARTLARLLAGPRG